jgi:epoxyqueuosine reductase
MKPALFPEEFLRDLGVLDWGYTEEPVPRSFARYEAWTAAGLHEPLAYLGDHRREVRRDIRNVFPEFRSALVFLFSYQETKKFLLDEDRHDVAAYSLGFGGADYHPELRARLRAIRARIPHVKAYLSLDVSPILERDLAYRAGLGWFGKNSMLINRRHGSYFLIGSILLDRPLPFEAPALDVDHCGQCVACAEACPTQAIDVATRTLVAEKCISTFTIELTKPAPPPAGYEASRGEVFGCDICQDVCPWNRKPLTGVVGRLALAPQFEFLRAWFFEWPREKLRAFIEEKTNRGVLKAFSGTAFERPGRSGWLKNLRR